ncbi:MAG: hypothetical protein AAF411_02635 [Myxococcota bacterium]
MKNSHKNATSLTKTVLVVAALLLGACGSDSEEAVASRGRLVLSSTTDSQVFVADLDTAEVYPFPVQANAAFIWGWAESPYAWVVHYPHNRVELIDSGSRFAPGGAVEKSVPLLHDFSLDGAAPTHVTRHDGWFSVYFDGIGEARLISEAGVENGPSVAEVVPTNIPHHGVALVTHDHIVITEGREATPEDDAEQWGPTIPTSVSIRTLAAPTDVVHQSEECTKLHGEATVGSTIAYGCDEGILLVTVDDAGPRSNRLNYPSESPFRTFTFRAAGNGFLGDYGAGLLYVEPGDDSAQTWALPDDVMQVAFAVDEATNNWIVLGIDGRLYRVSGADRTLLGAPVEVRAPIEDPSVRLSLVVASDTVYVLDASSTSVVAVDTNSWTVSPERTLEMPTPVASGAVVAMTR